MRVTFGAMHRNATSGIEAAAERLTNLQRQVSSGKRL
jgi:flagellin-like hook-associated protein FlgL